MNDVHAPIPAEKVREVLRRSPSGYLSTDETVAAYKDLRKSLSVLLEDAEPVIEEPTEFGSIVRAGIDSISDRVLWVRSAAGYWFSETSRRADFSDLYHPEVLRIGVGEAQPLTHADLPAMSKRAWEAKHGSPSDFDRANMADESVRLDEANALEDARGKDHVSLDKVLEVLHNVREDSITATEKEAVQRCSRALMVLPTYATCVSRAYP